MNNLPSGTDGNWEIISTQPDPITRRVTSEFAEFMLERPPLNGIPNVCSYYVASLGRIVFGNVDTVELLERTKTPTIYPDISAIFGAFGTIKEIQDKITAYINGMVIPEFFSHDDQTVFKENIIAIIKECISGNLKTLGVRHSFIGQDANAFDFSDYPIDRQAEIIKYIQIMVRFASDCGVKLLKGSFDQPL